MGALWALRHGEDARPLADRAADLLLAEQEETPSGLNWLFVPRRFVLDPPVEMPNFSHGLAGIAAVLAVAGVELGAAGTRRPRPSEAPSIWSRSGSTTTRDSGYRG